MYELFAIWHDQGKALEHYVSMLNTPKMLGQLETINGVYFDHTEHKWVVYLGTVDNTPMVEVLDIDKVGSPVDMILEHFNL